MPGEGRDRSQRAADRPEIAGIGAVCGGTALAPLLPMGRRPFSADARAVILAIAFLVACDTVPPGGPSATVRPAGLSVTVLVANTRFGNAISSDFTVMVRMFTGSSAQWRGDKDILILGDGKYDVDVVAAPDGYSKTRSTSCSSSAGVHNSLPPCVITETELPLGCDDALWAPTYSRDRLKVLSNCEGATGVVREVSRQHDGDLVLRIVPDGPYRFLLRDGNAVIQNQLVVEIPCQGSIDQADAVGTCDRYKGPIVTPPAIGAHIAVAAHHVQDSNHGMWAELHGANLRLLTR